MSELVVVGVDGSPDSRAALRWAIRQADRPGYRLLVAHVWTPIPRFHELPPLRQAQLEHDRARRIDDAEQRVAEALREVGLSPGGTVDTLVLEGSPGSNLVRLGDDAAQIVLGATGLGTPAGQMRPPLGSTVRHVLRHARCPVTVVSGDRLADEPSEYRLRAGSSTAAGTGFPHR